MSAEREICCPPTRRCRCPLTQAIRRGSFRSVKDLIAAIGTFIANWNAGATPFIWVKTADEILAKAVRKPRATNEPGH